MVVVEVVVGAVVVEDVVVGIVDVVCVVVDVELLPIVTEASSEDGGRGGIPSKSGSDPKPIN